MIVGFFAFKAPPLIIFEISFFWARPFGPGCTLYLLLSELLLNDNDQGKQKDAVPIPRAVQGKKDDLSLVENSAHQSENGSRTKLGD